jgi:hypothetical protein
MFASTMKTSLTSMVGSPEVNVQVPTNPALWFVILDDLIIPFLGHAPSFLSMLFFAYANAHRRRCQCRGRNHHCTARRNIAATAAMIIKNAGGVVVFVHAP